MQTSIFKSHDVMTSPLHFSKDPTDSFAVKKLFDENSLGPLYS